MLWVEHSWPRGEVKNKVDDFDKCVLMCIILEFQWTRGSWEPV